VFKPMSLANPFTKDRVASNGNTESWSPLQRKIALLAQKYMTK